LLKLKQALKICLTKNGGPGYRCSLDGLNLWKRGIKIKPWPPQKFIMNHIKKYPNIGHTNQNL